MECIELTTMCAVFKQNKVLMINRKKNWKGWAFPGGHIESGESVFDCVKREIKEEAGIELKEVQFRGITNIYNTRSKTRHIIFNFIAYEYEGVINDMSDEGEVEWIDISQISNMDLAEGMEYRLPLFKNSEISELYIEWDDENGYTEVKYC